MSDARSAGDLTRAWLPVLVCAALLHFGRPTADAPRADAPQQPVFIPVVVPTVLNGPTPTPTPDPKPEPAPKPAPDPTPTPAPVPDPPAPVPPPTPAPTPRPTPPTGYTGKVVALYCLGPKPDTDLMSLRRARPVLDAFEADLNADWVSPSTPVGWTTNQAILATAAAKAPCVIWIGVGQVILGVTPSPNEVNVIEGLKKIRGLK